MGADCSRRTLEVARANRKGTRCIQMSSNWGAPRRNLRFIYKTRNKRRTNIRKLAEHLRNGSVECLHKWSAVLQSPCRGNRKELSYLSAIGAVTTEGNFNITFVTSEGPYNSKNQTV